MQSGNAVAGTPFPIYSFATTFPTVTPKYVSMGTAYPMSRNARTTLGLTDAWSTRKGKHSLRLTGQANFYQVNSFNPYLSFRLFPIHRRYHQPAGNYRYGRSFCRLSARPAGFGGTHHHHRTVLFPRKLPGRSPRRTGMRARKNLTLNATLTFSRRTPRTEKYNRQSNCGPRPD